MTEDGTDADGRHDRPFCLDAHSDVLFSVVRERSTGRENVIETDFLAGMDDGGIDARVVAVYVDQEFLPEKALPRSLRIIEDFHAEVSESDALVVATSADDFRDAREAGRYPLLLGMEGAEPLKTDLSLLGTFYRLGVRLLTLTHSRRNAVGDGSFLSPAVSGSPGGLSRFGVEVVERMNDLGMVVDVSHLNDPGFWDVMDVSADPVVASHSNCRALWDHPRNLTDDQIEAIAAAGGVVGMNTIARFVSSGTATLDDLLDHLDHVVDVAGVSHVGLGFDFCEYLIPYLSDAERERTGDLRSVAGASCDEEVQNVLPALAERGYDRRERAAIAGGNFLRVFEEVL